MATLVHCYNKGCGQKFDLENNGDDACQYHPGVPVFHDAMKGWSCCKKRSTDFTVFLNYPGCTKGKHTNEKPPEPVKQETNSNKDEVIEVKMPAPTKPKDPNDRPSADDPMMPLKSTIASSLKQALEKTMQNLNLQANTSENDAVKEVKLGESCKNNSCKATYNGENSNQETCTYHPGVPIFHEGMKFWSCCQRKTSDFDVFLEQEGCERGNHLWIKAEVPGEKKSCRFDWHQTPSTVTISIFSKVAVPEKCSIKANRVRCDIKVVFEGGKSLFERDIVLRDVIDPEKSQVKLLGTKVEINLKKTEAFSWPTLEFPQAVEKKDANEQC